VVVVDDICDGGGTFLGVAAAMRARYGGALQLHLFTSHGIYSKGAHVLLESAYQTIGSTDSFSHGIAHSRLYTIPMGDLT
jgi:ribose-phosphate pyrophosphokinase